ncbi:hypothetical protein VMCG_04072 [Cytospora schulzeri]|uniref:Angiopoietin-1/2/4 domain-containing protein n=1 Tax=Cytospora schulzeri TaxID=448051 RepID=A0A423WTS4_9PEZI|nr:hypothetical protein VMCG_04072 [Valsa malicola]
MSRAEIEYPDLVRTDVDTTGSDLDEVVYVDSKKIAEVHVQNKRLEARVRELEGQLASSASSPCSSRSHVRRIIESQSRYIEDQENKITDMRQSEQLMKQKIRGLEDQLDNIKAVTQERLRARDARIAQLGEESWRANHAVDRMQICFLDSNVVEAVEAIRSNIMNLVEKQEKEIANIERTVGLSKSRLEEYLVLVMKSGIIEMQKTCTKEVTALGIAINNVEFLLKAATSTSGDEE